jgi:opacity protein-like surface antigen
MKKLFAAAVLAVSTMMMAQTPVPDPLVSLDFLLGTWSANTGATRTSGGQAMGTYTFSRDLGGHALQRTSTVANCKGPQDFDCNHNDQLTIFPDSNAQAVHHSSLLALFLDNEGHVIYYTLTTPDPQTVIFNSQSAPNTPKFRLIYHLEGSGPKAVMSGKFQMAAPGSDDYDSYLEWSGTRLK